MRQFYSRLLFFLMVGTAFAFQLQAQQADKPAPPVTPAAPAATLKARN
jgi:hypothetical protein